MRRDVAGDACNIVLFPSDIDQAESYSNPGMTRLPYPDYRTTCERVDDDTEGVEQAVVVHRNHLQKQFLFIF